MSAIVELRGKCTSCKKSYTLTVEQQREAREIGCAFSPCCQAVATVTTVTVKRSSTRDSLNLAAKTTRMD